MGYGLKSPGFWNGKKHFTWKLTKGKGPAKLQQAFAIWEDKVGVTFTKSDAPSADADFDVQSDQGMTGWSDSLKQLNFKGGEPLGTVLHEIGHLMGLSHEHDRADSRDAYYQADTAMGGFGLQGAKSRAGKLQEYGQYDHDSIMQYPASTYEQKTEPSDGDVSTVKQINGW